MNSKRLKGLTVISIADGEKLGAIDRIFLDPATKRVVGFSIRHGGVLGLDAATGEAKRLIDVDDVHAVGPDAMTVADKGSLRGDQTRAQLSSLLDLADVAKRKVVTDGGTYVGEVASEELDDRTFRLDAVEVSPGFFKTNIHVPIAQVINIGNELIVVDDAVCASSGAETRMPAAVEGSTPFGTGTAEPATTER